MAAIAHNDIPYGITLHPTMQEFSNFAEYWEKIEKEKKITSCGVIKVVPPQKWKPRAQPLADTLDNIMVNSPIEQNVYGKAGVYELLLLQKKSMTVKDYRKKVEAFDVLTDKKTPEQVESLFWKNICFSPPLYGADMKGSLFDDGVKWNLKELNGVLRDGLPKNILGVNDPYLYVGSWKTMFGWHKEDLDLYSINYVHYGKPKFWYCLPPSEGPKLEKFARQQYGDSFGKCKEYLRHKTLMINPYLLKQQIPDLKIHKMIHYPGEFVITLGGAYHAGFNFGFNVAEAVNFATTKWLDILPNTGCCKCVKDSVKIDPLEFYTNLAHSEYADHPTVKKNISDLNISTAATTSSAKGRGKDKMEIEKPSRSDRKTSIQYPPTPSTRGEAHTDAESTEEEEQSAASPSAENIKTRSSSRAHQRKSKAVSRTAGGSQEGHGQTKSEKKPKVESVEKGARSKKIQKSALKPTKARAVTGKAGRKI